MCLQGHMGRVGEERCAYVRALVVANRALMSRGHLEEQADNWLAQSGTLPPGNGVERDLWEVRCFLSPLPFPSPFLCRKGCCECSSAPLCSGGALVVAVQNPQARARPFREQRLLS